MEQWYEELSGRRLRIREMGRSPFTPMLFFEILRQMLRTLWAHKLRSFLTMFGIAWGVGSLLLLVGLGEGFRSGNRRELNSLGEDIMFIFPGARAGCRRQYEFRPRVSPHLSGLP